MDIRIIRFNFYSKVAKWAIRLSQKLDYLSGLCVWKWYKAMEEHPRATKELLNSVHNNPAFRKIFERFENGQS